MKYKVTKVKPQGYCGGVLKAIQTAKECRKQNPDMPITILGNLVHNSYVKKALQLYDLKTIEDPSKTRWELLDQILEGIVIFTAHGVSDRVREKANAKGLKIIDATCEYVSFIHSLIKDKLSEGYTIVYIGKKNHPESEAVLEISDKVHLIETEADLTFTDEKLFFTNQTTLSSYQTAALYETIVKKYPNAVISNEICNATRCRQQAVMELEKVDALVVVGDPKSHNTQKLAQLAQQKAAHVFCV